MFLGGIVYSLSPIVLGFAVWRSAMVPRRVALLLVVSGVIAVAAFLDLTLAQVVQPPMSAAAYLATAVVLWPHAFKGTRTETP